MLIAKFSVSGDLYSLVEVDVIAMKLTAACGKDGLWIKHFDRTRAGEDRYRKATVSAPAILGLDEIMVRYTPHENLAEIIRHRVANHKVTLGELFGLFGKKNHPFVHAAAKYNSHILTLRTLRRCHQWRE